MRGFYKGKKVLVTGHTGFKGSWLCQILLNLDAKVIGYSLKPPTEPNLYSSLKLEDKITSVIGDISDYNKLLETIKTHKPEIVLHLAAQPIVSEGYENPVYTYQTNVMGTVNILEAVRQTDTVKSVVNVTTDKVYLNKEWEWGYRENEELNGFDPYSNSKSCSDIITQSYYNSYFKEKKLPVSTMRAGNVIGGGDFSLNRIIPDCYRAVESNETIYIRSPYSIRPYQHVIEPLYAYLLVAKKQYEEIEYASSYNIGPVESDNITTQEIATLFCDKWGAGANFEVKKVDFVHEANFLKLDCNKIHAKCGFKPEYNIEKAIEKTVEWYKAYKNNEDVIEVTNVQIKEYLNAKI